MAALFEAFCRAFFQSPSPELNWSTLMCKLPRRKNNYPGMHRWDAKHLPNVYFSPPRCLQTLSITSQTLALAQTLQVTLWIKNTYNPYPGPPGHGNRLGACGPLPHSPGAPRPRGKWFRMFTEYKCAFAIINKKPELMRGDDGYEEELREDAETMQCHLGKCRRVTVLVARRCENLESVSRDAKTATTMPR